MNHREHRLQAWGHKFIERVVMPPMFTGGIDSPFRRAMNDKSRVAAFNRLGARGIIPGMPDTFVIQGDGQDIRALLFIEYKSGTRVSSRQEAVHKLMARAGATVTVAHDIWQIREGLIIAGFVLHGNHQNICAEYEEKLQAADRQAA